MLLFVCVCLLLLYTYVRLYLWCFVDDIELDFVRSIKQDLWIVLCGIGRSTTLLWAPSSLMLKMSQRLVVLFWGLSGVKQKIVSDTYLFNMHQLSGTEKFEQLLTYCHKSVGTLLHVLGSMFNTAHKSQGYWHDILHQRPISQNLSPFMYTSDSAIASLLGSSLVHIFMLP